MSDPTPTLRIANVSKRYDDRRVLRSVSFDVNAGEALFLLGANGAGKSTLMKIVAGQLRADQGSVEIMGAALKAKHASNQLAMIGHEPGLHPSLSVKENLTWNAQALGIREAEKRVADLSETFDLGRIEGQEASALSRGQAQRAGLARALLSKPKLLLLDEPFTGLDERARALLLSHLRSYIADGGAIFLTSHDLLLASDLATRSLWLHKGKIESDGDVLANFRKAMAPKSA